MEGGALAMTSLVLEVRHVNATLLGVNASYAETCRAVTQCLLKPLKAAVETETCSDLVRRETFAYRTTMDFADDVRVEVRGVSVARDALLGAAAKACFSENMPSYQIVRIDADSRQHLYVGFVAFAVLCALVVALAFVSRTCTCAFARRSAEPAGSRILGLATSASQKRYERISTEETATQTGA